MKIRPVTPPPPPPAQPSTSRQESKAPDAAKPGVCFACGIPGHWRKDCEAAKEASNKISESLCQAFASNESFDSNVNSPVGRLKENVDQWVAIGAHEYILNVIRFGLHIAILWIATICCIEK